MKASQLWHRLWYECLHLNYQGKDGASLGRLISSVQEDGLAQDPPPPCARLNMSVCSSLQCEEGHMGCKLSEPQLREGRSVSRSVERRILSGHRPQASRTGALLCDCSCESAPVVTLEAA